MSVILQRVTLEKKSVLWTSRSPVESLSIFYARDGVGIATPKVSKSDADVS